MYNQKIVLFLQIILFFEVGTFPKRFSNIILERQHFCQYLKVFSFFTYFLFAKSPTKKSDSHKQKRFLLLAVSNLPMLVIVCSHENRTSCFNWEFPMHAREAWVMDGAPSGLLVCSPGHRLDARALCAPVWPTERLSKFSTPVHSSQKPLKIST